MFLLFAIALLSTLSNADARWEQVGLAIIGKDEDNSGYSVAMSADGFTVAIGAIESDNNGENTGHVRVYKFNPDMDGGVWLQLGQDIDGAQEEERSGYSVAMSADGSRLAIGSIYAHNSEGAEYAGKVKIFDFDPEMDGGVWIQVGADIEGEMDHDKFGVSLSMNGEGSKIVIGGTGHDIDYGPFNAGHAQIYEYKMNSGNWVQVGEDILGTDDYDYFGSSVSMNSAGSHIAVAAGEYKYDDYGPGAVRVYENKSGSWVQVGTRIDGESIGDGAIVSMSSSALMVTIGSMSANADHSGQVRVFKYDGEGWVQVGQDIDGEAEMNGSGETVVMSADGSMLAIGASWNNDFKGHVRVFELQNEMWVQLGDDIDGEQHEDWKDMAPYFGGSLTMSADGSMLAIGASQYGKTQGHVKVYKLHRDCEGTFISCTSACETSAQRTFDMTVAKSGNGKECPSVAADCMPLDGACPDNIDCEGSWSTCTAACETSAQRNFIKTVAKSGNGKECPAAADCMPLDGACPDSPACEDVQPPVWYGNNSCAKQKSAGKCPMRVQENSMYCRKTCGMCGSDYTIPDCHDIEPPSHWKNNSCAKQKAGNKCEKRKQKNSVYCRKTCGICGDTL